MAVEVPFAPQNIHTPEEMVKAHTDALFAIVQKLIAGNMSLRTENFDLKKMLALKSDAYDALSEHSSQKDRMICELREALDEALTNAPRRRR
jgi:hypothetical protein